MIGLSHPLSVNEIWSTMQGIVQNCISCTEQKNAPILGDVRRHGQYGSKPVTRSELFKTQQGIFHVTSPNKWFER